MSRHNCFRDYRELDLSVRITHRVHAHVSVAAGTIFVSPLGQTLMSDTHHCRRQEVMLVPARAPVPSRAQAVNPMLRAALVAVAAGTVFAVLACCGARTSSFTLAAAAVVLGGAAWSLVWPSAIRWVGRRLQHRQRANRESVGQSSRSAAPAMAAFCCGVVATLGLQHLPVQSIRALSDIGGAANAPVMSAISTGSLAPIAAPAPLVDENVPVNEPTVSGAITRVFAHPPRSPRGRESAGITREDALAFADRNLRGANGMRSDRAEAAYWLKHALATTLNDASLVWALTQLGSVLATPGTGEPDYNGAGAIWQIAAALGDPVAYCFLGRTHEFGLGMKVDRRTARSLYSRALSAGGCPGLMQSLSRLQEP